MANTLQLYFPKLRERQQILDDILSRENLKREGHAASREGCKTSRKGCVHCRIKGSACKKINRHIKESRNPPWDRQLK